MGDLRKKEICQVFSFDGKTFFFNHISPAMIGPARAIDAVALHSDLRQLDVSEFNVSGWVLDGMCLSPMFCLRFVVLVGFDLQV